jgi:hypothetical protein
VKGNLITILLTIVLFWDRGEINWSGLGCGGSSSRDVLEIVCKLCTWQFACLEVSYCID